ncbi:TPA: ribosomal-processing cysteine protease Prp [Candidatus Bipolaricaulota bacterium]|nr:ribosomal-processing cysteine protease Prp [Candidatus Bipolaricaulota bacterium]
MIAVEVYRDNLGKICEFRSSTGGYEAQDPLKVSVMALVQTAIIGLEDYLKLEPEVSEEEGVLRCKLERESFLNREIDAILETMVLGLRALEREHPESLEVREVGSGVKV